jgi:septal ring factor EnvC (AmiA/AmiB activator)
MWPFNTRHLKAEIDAIKADRERIREERNQFVKDRDAFKASAETAARQFAEADATNRRLSGRNLELGRRNSTLTESDPEYAAGLERQVAELQKRLDDTAREPADGEWRGRARRAEKRVDHLQRELDNALGMPSGGLLDSSIWQPGYEAPKPDTKAVGS